MTLGTAAIGLSGYVFLGVVGHGRLDPMAAAALASVYLLSNILGPGVFVAVEQETSRQVSTEVAGRTVPPTGLRPAPSPPAHPAGSAGRAPLSSKPADGTARATVALAAATLLVLAVVAAPLTATSFRGDATLVATLAVGVLGSAAVFRVRGVLGGERRFRRYGSGLLVDAGVRIVGVVALAAGGVTAAWAYALALGLAPGVAALTTRTRSAARLAPGRGTGRAIGSLLVGSLLAMAVANLAPVLVTAALPDDPARAFAFACALVLTRAPLLLMGPVQALLLPTAAAAAAHGRIDEVRGQLRRGLAVVGTIGLVAVPGSWLLGRPVLRLVFGPAADLLPAGTVTVLTGSAVVFMAVALVQPALVASGAHRVLVVGWSAGAVAFVVGFASLVGLDPVAAAVVATVAAPAVTLLVQLAGIHRLRPGAQLPPAPPPPGSSSSG